MPELPEVETTRRGIAPHVEQRVVVDVTVREPRLRWPVSPRLAGEVAGRRIAHVDRRGKYLLLRTGSGSLIIHLGMSGSLRRVEAHTPPGRHDHVDLLLDSGFTLRFHDPRRFGAVLWTSGDPLAHRLLHRLGPEPLSPQFDGAYLAAMARNRRVPIKGLLMNAQVVVGVGNIYANEALFRAGIHPARAAGHVSARRLKLLAAAVQEVLSEAIASGGTTLRDFVSSEGRPGYFARNLDVYGRAGEACPGCGGTIRRVEIAQRSTFYCGRCQR